MNRFKLNVVQQGSGLLFHIQEFLSDRKLAILRVGQLFQVRVKKIMGWKLKISRNCFPPHFLCSFEFAICQSFEICVRKSAVK